MLLRLGLAGAPAAQGLPRPCVASLLNHPPAHPPAPRPQGLAGRLGGALGVLRCWARCLLVAGAKSYTHMVTALERYYGPLKNAVDAAGLEVGGGSGSFWLQGGIGGGWAAGGQPAGGR